MSSGSAIQWTDDTFNSWWGCLKIAQGCKFCYAEGVAERFYGRQIWGPNSERKIASEKVWNDPARWNKRAARDGIRRKVFCLSMGDVLEDHPQLVEPRKRLVGIIETTPMLDWQLLTKRPENHAMFGWGSDWPENVWFGTSAAQQGEYNQNADAIGKCAARVKFFSLEPLIGPIVLFDGWNPDWIIVGGESGRSSRPCDLAWIHSIVKQCAVKGIACFVKQVGAKPENTDASLRCWGIVDAKGGDMSEWPAAIQVRQFPKPGVPA